MITLYYGAISPYTRKVRIMLAELGVAFETEQTDLADPAAGFLAVNPNRRIPALSDGDVHLFESNLILDYLLQRYFKAGMGDPPLCPQMVRPEHRWEDLKILNTIETTLDSGLNLFQFGKENYGADQSAYLKAEQRRIASNLDWLEQRATPQGFVPGEMSVLDLNLICTLEWADFRKPFDWSGRPNLRALIDFYKDREAISATRPAQ